MVRAIPYELNFKRPAGTSRGVLRTKKSWFLIHEGPEGIAIGECGIFAGLSAEDKPEYEGVLLASIDRHAQGALDLESLRDWPSIRCGWEMLLADMASGGRHQYFDLSPGASRRPIPINGLVWMGPKDDMAAQIAEKIAAGFSCVKLKIGAIDLADELALLGSIREEFSAKEIELRVDANGAFTADEALEVLKRLSEHDIHSIEQPIRQGQWDEMARLCAESPVPIALDEELIGLHDLEEKRKLIEHIAPQYIILKPSLHGGFSGSDEWIDLAQAQGTPWWATSALESNVGLSAIAQWLASKDNPLPQGLGTGALYTNNIPAPHGVLDGHFHLQLDGHWDLSPLGV